MKSMRMHPAAKQAALDQANESLKVSIQAAEEDWFHELGPARDRMTPEELRLAWVKAITDVVSQSLAPHHKPG